MLTQVQKAQDEFQVAMKDLGIGLLKIKDDEGKVVSGVNTLAMALPDMWLPKLMMRADDVGCVIVGERVFDVGYKYNQKTLTGISAEEISSEEKEEYGYNTNVISDDNLRRLIIKQVAATSVGNESGFAFLNEFETYHLSNENDTFIRPMDNNLVVAAMLRDFTGKALPVLEKTLRNENSMEPRI